MRRMMVAGNWKLNKGPREAEALARILADELARMRSRADVLVCPPFVSIPAVRQVLAAYERPPLLLGGQNCAFEDSGAYTGEVSAPMLREAGASHVIIAHSERRSHFGEQDDQFVRKLDRAHAAGLVAIFCFGEELVDRRAGRHEQVVRAQLEAVLPRIQKLDPDTTILAYEPVWAIGTGETATPEQAQQMHAFARVVLRERFSSALANAMRILYGGSMKPDNARELFGRPDLDGGLVGGASLKAADFLGIVEAAE
jgi:triosephosphate isomerase (TIM)